MSKNLTAALKTISSGDRAGGVAALEAAYQADAADTGLAFSLAVHADQLGDEDTALAAYAAIAAREQAPVDALVNYAVLLEDAGRYAEAEQVLRRVLAAQPNHARARLYMKDVRASRASVVIEAVKDDGSQMLLNSPITDYDLSPKTKALVRKTGLRTLGDLARATPGELRTSRNFPDEVVDELARLMALKGLRLGQAVQTAAPAPMVESDPAVMSRPLGDLDLSVRCKKAVEVLGCVTVGDLCMKTEDELLGLKNFGETSLDEIKQKLTNLGCQLREPDDEQ